MMLLLCPVVLYPALSLKGPTPIRDPSDPPPSPPSVSEENCFVWRPWLALGLAAVVSLPMPVSSGTDDLTLSSLFSSQH